MSYFKKKSTPPPPREREKERERERRVERERQREREIETQRERERRRERGKEEESAAENLTTSKTDYTRQPFSSWEQNLLPTLSASSKMKYTRCISTPWALRKKIFLATSLFISSGRLADKDLSHKERH